MTRNLTTTALKRAGQTRHYSPENTLIVTTVLHQFAESLGAAVDAKDAHTWQHSEEVAQIAHTLALSMGLKPQEADLVHVAGHLHDIGKIGIPDAILSKQGALTPQEWAKLQEHPAIGADIVKPVASLVRCGVASIILHHHERFDGKGYPHGLSGTSIPLGARIVALADSLSAMLQHRPYREARTFESAAAEIERMAGTQFDPAVVAAFIRTKGSLKAIMEALKNENAQSLCPAHPTH